MISGEEVDFCTVTPNLFTSSGSCDVAWLLRIWARIWSVFASVATSKFTVSLSVPSLPFTDAM